MVIAQYLTTVFIIIHGTWAAKEPWPMPEGDFFQQVEKQCKKDEKVISFHWTGTLSSNARRSAAQSLVKLIESYPPKTKFVVAGHSHGGNVGVIASQLLGQKKDRKHHIHTLINLATPVDADYYMPDMSVIRYVFNFFSFSDRVQSVFGFFQYEYPPHDRIANIRISLNGLGTSHSEAHDPIIGKWLPHLERLLLDNDPEHPSFSNFNFKQEGIIHFVDNRPPIFAFDTEREFLREIEKFIEHNRIVAAIIRSKEEKIEKIIDYEKQWAMIENHYHHDHPDLLQIGQAIR